MTEKTNCIFIVYAQVYENKGWPDSEDWRPKFGQEFSLKINYTDTAKHEIHYPWDSSFLPAIFTQLLKNESNDYYRYEYLSHEVWFGNPKRLDKDEFFKMLTTIIEEISNEIL